MNETTTYTDLEIRIFKPDDHGYPVELLADNRQQFQGRLAADFLPWVPTASPVEDGYRLFKWLFQDATLLRAWGQIRGQNAYRRIRLRLDIDAPELHAIPWELLRDTDPDYAGQIVAVDSRTPFSRYIAGKWDPGQRITAYPIKMLVVIANPNGLAEYGLDNIDVKLETTIIQEALAHLAPDQLELRFLTETVSLSRLAIKLKKEVDILHLVAHGVFSNRRQTASLYLADEEDDVHLIQADTFAEMIGRLSAPPQLIYLSSCQTATTSPADAFRGFAPTLITAGIPAVLAMQDRISVQTAQAFTQTFYRQLLDHGQVDLASNEARAAILNADLPGSSIPVLFSRLPDNHLISIATEGTGAQAGFPPPPEPARPPVLDNFVGRQTELRYFVQKLQENHLAVISGMPGVGKTTLAAALAQTWQGWQLANETSTDQQKQPHPKREPTAKSNIFWHTFHPDEAVLSVIWQLAGFAAWHGQPGLWQMLQGAQQSGGQPPPLASLLDYVIKLIEGQGYLLCLDDVQYVREDPELLRLIDRLRELVVAGEVDLILTSREVPDYVRTTTFEALGGLSPADMAQLVRQQGLTLNQNLLTTLYTHTEGNAELLMLALNLLQQADDVTQVIHNLAEADDVARYLVREVDDTLSETDREVMIAVAILLGYPGSREAIETVSKRNRLKRVLINLSDRHLLQSQADETIEAYNEHVIVRAFYYDVPNRRELRILHKLAGEYYALDEPDYFKAALHFVQAGEYEKGAQIAITHVGLFINQGLAKALGRLLKAFSAKNLSPEYWANVNMARGEVEAFLGNWSLGKQCFETALAHLNTRPNATQNSALKAKAYRGIGETMRDQFPQEALSWFEQGLKILGDIQSDERATILLRMSGIFIYQGDNQAAKEKIQTALSLISANHTWLRLEALNNLGLVYARQGALDKAMEVTQQGLAISQNMHDVFRTTWLWNNLAMYRDMAGDWPGALEAYQQALAGAQEIGNIYSQVIIKSNQAYLYTLQGNIEEALPTLEQSLNQTREHDLSRPAILILSNLATVYLLKNDLQQAENALVEAEALTEQIDFKEDLPSIYRGWAQLYLIRKEADEAFNYAEQAVSLSQQLEVPVEEGISLRFLALAHLANSRTEAAVEAFSQSLALLEGNDPYEAARTRLEWGRCLLSGEDVERGKALLQQAQATFERLGASRDIAKAKTLLDSSAKNQEQKVGDSQ